MKRLTGLFNIIAVVVYIVRAVRWWLKSSSNSSISQFLEPVDAAACQHVQLRRIPPAQHSTNSPVGRFPTMGQLRQMLSHSRGLPPSQWACCTYALVCVALDMKGVLSAPSNPLPAVLMVKVRDVLHGRESLMQCTDYFRHTPADMWPTPGDLPQGLYGCNAQYCILLPCCLLHSCFALLRMHCGLAALPALLTLPCSGTI